MVVDCFPANSDRATIRRQQAVGDVKQSGFSRAVFAEKRVDLPASEGEIHPVERKNGPEALGDPVELEQGLFGSRIRDRWDGDGTPREG